MARKTATRVLILGVAMIAASIAWLIALWRPSEPVYWGFMVGMIFGICICGLGITFIKG